MTRRPRAVSGELAAGADDVHVFSSASVTISTSDTSVRPSVRSWLIQIDMFTVLSGPVSAAGRRWSGGVSCTQFERSFTERGRRSQAVVDSSTRREVWQTDIWLFQPESTAYTVTALYQYQYRMFLSMAQEPCSSSEKPREAAIKYFPHSTFIILGLTKGTWPYMASDSLLSCISPFFCGIWGISDLESRSEVIRGDTFWRQSKACVRLYIWGRAR